MPDDKDFKSMVDRAVEEKLKQLVSPKKEEPKQDWFPIVAAILVVGMLAIVAFK